MPETRLPFLKPNGSHTAQGQRSDTDACSKLAAWYRQRRSLLFFWLWAAAVVTTLTLLVVHQARLAGALETHINAGGK